MVLEDVPNEDILSEGIKMPPSGRRGSGRASRLSRGCSHVREFGGVAGLSSWNECCVRGRSLLSVDVTAESLPQASLTVGGLLQASLMVGGLGQASLTVRGLCQAGLTVKKPLRSKSFRWALKLGLPEVVRMIFMSFRRGYYSPSTNLDPLEC
jgi:hypothetical protein